MPYGSQLHYHHRESIASELEKRILLLLWVSVLLCLCIATLVVHVDAGGVAVCCSMFATSVLGYLTTQLRHHQLTKAVWPSHSLTQSLPHPLKHALTLRRPTTRATNKRSTNHPPPSACHALCRELLASLCVQLVVEVAYVLYECCVRGLSLLARHYCLLLHCLVACVLLACVVVTHRLCANEEETDRWAAAEEDMDALTQRATLDTYQTALHHIQHDKEAKSSGGDWI